MKLTSRIGETKSVSLVKELIVDVHLDYIEKDGYVWRYNEDTKKYYNTGICLMGKLGNSGPPGRKGDNGLSAYLIAREHGFDGNVQAWLDSLKGKSAYEIAVENGFEGTEEEWLNLIGGEGKSAYQIWQELPGNENKSVYEFLAWMKDTSSMIGPKYAATANDCVMVNNTPTLYYVPNGSTFDVYLADEQSVAAKSLATGVPGDITNYAGIYDISQDHINNGVPATYGSLQEAVAAIPSGVGKGGMEIKYIDSNSGKYRQFRLVTPYFGTPPQLVDLSSLQGTNIHATNGVWAASNITGVYTKRYRLEDGKTYTIVAPTTNENNVACGYLKSTDTYTINNPVVYSTSVQESYQNWHGIEKGTSETIVADGSDVGFIYWRSDGEEKAGTDYYRQDPVIYVQDTDTQYTFNEDDWVEYSSESDTPSGAAANIEIDTAALKRLNVGINSSTNKWGTMNTGYYTKFLVLSKGCTYRLVAKTGTIALGLLTQEDTHESGSDVSFAEKSEWHGLSQGKSEVFHVAEDSDKYYLAFRADTAGNNANSVLCIYKSINNAEIEDTLATVLSKKTITYKHNTSHNMPQNQNAYKPNYFDNTDLGFEVGKKYRIRAMVSAEAPADIEFYLRKDVSSETTSFSLNCIIYSGNYASDWVNYTPSDSNNKYISSSISAEDYNVRYIIEIEELGVNEVIADDTRLLNKAFKVYTKQDVGLENYTFADIVTADDTYYKVNNSSGTRVIVQLPVLPTNIKLTFNSGYKVSIHQWNLKGTKLLQNINSNDDVFLSSGFWFMSDIEIGKSTDDTDIREDANTVFLCIAKENNSVLSLQDTYDNINFEIIGSKVELPTHYNYSGFISLGNRGFNIKKVLNVYSEQPLNMQGADCYNGYLVIGGANGTLNVFDIEDGSLIGTIQVPAIDGETGRYPHFNTLKFAKNLHDGNNQFPYIYASEGRHNQDDTVEVNEDRIFVYDLTYDGTTFTLTEVQRYNTNLLRGIEQDTNISRVSSNVGFILDFALDEDGGYLYLIGNKNLDGYDHTFVWSKVRLHAVSEGDITIPTEELIDVWESKGYPARQGCFYWQGLAYVLAGQFDYKLDDSNPLTKVHNYMMAMNVGTKVQQAEVDLAQFMIDLSSLATANGANEEPEAIFVYNNKTYILSYSTEKNGQNVSLHSRFYLYEVSFDSSGYNSNSQSTIGRVSNLDGKKIVALGDSYLLNVMGSTTEERARHVYDITWLNKIAVKHNMTYVNYGVSGNAMVSTTDNSNPQSSPMVTRYSDMDDDADFVLVVGGRNDYNARLPITDFKTGLRTLCEGLIAKYTDSGAKICFFTCWQSQKHGTDTEQYKQEEYADAIEEVCAEYSIPCFNSRKRSGVFAFDSAFRTKYFRNATDVSHLNAAGHDYFMPRAEAFLESL